VAARRPPDWDADSPRLHANLSKIAKLIRTDAKQRTLPGVEAARARQSAMMQGLSVPDALFVGRFRGEPGLETCGVRVGAVSGTLPWLVADELKVFEDKLRQIVASLDSNYRDADSLDDDGMDAVIELAAWAHSEWVRIHPFGNGNGRTARLWANLLLMRYGLRPVLKLRLRPDGAYADAGAMGMLGDFAALAALIRKLLDEAPPGASR
jgi:prophage maintenance system killer protein